MELLGKATVHDSVGNVVGADDLVVWLVGLRASKVDVNLAVGQRSVAGAGGVLPLAEGGSLLGVVHGEIAGSWVKIIVLGLSARGGLRLPWFIRDSGDFVPSSHVSGTVEVGERRRLVTDHVCDAGRKECLQHQFKY